MSGLASSFHKSGWFLALGIAYLLVGLMAISSPFLVTLVSVFFFGALLCAMGVAGLIHAFWARGWEGFAVQLLAGVLATVMGFLLMMDALAGAAVITLILATYFLVSGLFRLGFAISHAHLRHRGSLIFSGAVSLLLGILIAVHWPSSALWVIGTFIGIDLIFYGISFILLYFGRE
ncbi:MAG: HdeD family acid-resistance protein [Methylacidiphilales bacterium]|nr:HdeD family acid-resistance protein [Candidatus Methylacidiphilales bacterium]